MTVDGFLDQSRGIVEWKNCRCHGACITDRLHMLIVPRWEEDHNLMPDLSGVRGPPGSIETTYNQFRPDFEI